MTTTDVATISPDDAASLAQEYLNLKAQAAVIDDRIKDIVARLRTLGTGKHTAGDHTVSVGPQPMRFSSETASQVLKSNPDLLAQCQETIVSSAKAKKVLPPAVHALCSLPSGEARVNVA